MLMAVTANYFPAPGAVDAYTNNPLLYTQTQNAPNQFLSNELIMKINETGRVAKPGDVKYVFTTKPGPGPILQDIQEALIDPNTGQPRPAGPNHKKLQL